MIAPPRRAKITELKSKTNSPQISSNQCHQSRLAGSVVRG